MYTVYSTLLHTYNLFILYRKININWRLQKSFPWWQEKKDGWTGRPEEEEEEEYIRYSNFFAPPFFLDEDPWTSRIIVSDILSSSSHITLCNYTFHTIARGKIDWSEKMKWQNNKTRRRGIIRRKRNRILIQYNQNCTVCYFVPSKLD